MLEIYEPAHAYTKTQGAVALDEKPVCAWCQLPYEYADVIPWRSLAGDMEGVKIFHPECWGQATRKLTAIFEVAEQVGRTPAEVAP